MATKKTKRGWRQDRDRIATLQPREIYYIQQAYGVSGNDPATKCTTKKIRAVIAEMRTDDPKRVIMRVELMAALEAKGLIYHDATDGHAAGSPEHENISNEPY